MAKILGIKKWLTLDEAAAHMTAALGEPVSKADILFLTLDAKLQVSVDFINGAKAREFAVVSPEDVRRVPGLFGEYEVTLGMLMPDGNYLVEGETVVTLNGVFELAMIGAEIIDLESMYHELIEGPAPTGVSLNGAFVKRGDSFFQLLESFDENSFIVGSRAYTERARAEWEKNRKWSPEVESIADRKALTEILDQRKTYAEKQKLKPAYQKYYPSPQVPEDALYVVNAEKLRQLEASLNEPNETGSSKAAISVVSDGWDGFHQDDSFYPEELDIALQAWRAVSIACPSGRPLKHLKEYIKKMHPHLLDSQIKRIATVCNWDRSPGRPGEDE